MLHVNISNAHFFLHLADVGRLVGLARCHNSSRCRIEKTLIEQNIVVCYESAV